jgi:hypothetical protein
MYPDDIFNKWSSSSHRPAIATSSPKPYNLLSLLASVPHQRLPVAPIPPSMLTAFFPNAMISPQKIKFPFPQNEPAHPNSPNAPSLTLPTPQGTHLPDTDVSTKKASDQIQKSFFSLYQARIPSSQYHHKLFLSPQLRHR